MSHATEIKKAIKEKKIVYGRKTIIRGLKNNEFAKVFICKNTPVELRRDIKNNASEGTLIEEFDGTNYDLGVTMKKPFMITIIALKK